MSKSALRKKYLNQRLALSDQDYALLNRQLVDLFFQSVDLSHIQFLHVFLPIEKFNEVNTWQIIDRVQEHHAHIKLIIPKVVDQDLSHYVFEEKQQLVKDRWGIPEPQYGDLISPAEIDLVLVPLLVADHHGHRVGYGKGYYDRFLAQCRSDTHKIGLSLLPLSEDVIEAEKTDVKLDGCLTANGLFSFS